MKETFLNSIGKEIEMQKTQNKGESLSLSTVKPETKVSGGYIEICPVTSDFADQLLERLGGSVKLACLGIDNFPLGSTPAGNLFGLSIYLDESCVGEISSSDGFLGHFLPSVVCGGESICILTYLKVLSVLASIPKPEHPASIHFHVNPPSGQFVGTNEDIPKPVVDKSIG